MHQSSGVLAERRVMHVCVVQVPGLSTGALLLKFARPSQTLPSDPLTYSAR